MNFITRFLKNNELIGKLLTINLAALLVISTMIIFFSLIPLSHSEELVIIPNICVEKLVDFDNDGIFHEFETGSYNGTATWKINVSNCGGCPLYDVYVSDSNGMSWGSFNLDVGEFWEETYDEMNILEDKCNNVSAEGFDVSGGYVGPVFAEACVEVQIAPCIYVEKLVDFDNDGVFNEFETGSYNGTATWKINVSNCGDSPLSRVYVNDSNGMNWGPFNLDVNEYWETSYDETNILTNKCNNASTEGFDVFDGYIGPVYDEACVEVLINPDISITKSADIPCGAPSTLVNFTIVVENNGDCPLDPVIVEDTLPSGLSYVSDDNGGNHSSGVISWNLGLMNPFDEVTILLVAEIDVGSSGMLYNVVNVVGTPPFGDNVSDSDGAEVEAINPDISVIKTIIDSNFLYVNYSIIVENTGDCPLDPVIVEDTLPSGLSYVSDDSGGSHSSGMISWNLGLMSPAESKTIILVTERSGQYDEIWVDDSWYSQTTVDVFDSGLIWQVDAFNCIQNGVNAVNPGGVVHVRNGTYVEQVLINKSISLLAESDVTIYLPPTLEYYTIEGSSGLWAPAIFAYGGEMIDHNVCGTGTIGMIVDDFKIIGDFELNSTGILYHNVDCGVYETIFNNTVLVTGTAYCSDDVVMDSDYAQFISDFYLESIISNNTLLDFDIGIMLDGCSNCGWIIHNHIEWPYGTIGKIGILISGFGNCEPENIEIHYNYVGVDCGDNYGVLNLVGNLVNATLNWWSNPDGPDSPHGIDVFDPITGRIADGFGEKVGGLVHFDPWAGIDACMTVSTMSAMVGEPVFFDSACSFACHMDGSCYDFYDVKWKFDDGSYSFNDAPFHMYGTPGVYEVSLRVRAIDMDLWPFFMVDWAYVTVTISESGMPLVANADGQDLGGYEGEPGYMVHFYSYAIGGTPPYSYVWDFGDGSSPVYGQNPSHVYVDDNIYSVSLTVLDNTGVETTDVVDVIVSSGLLRAYMNSPSFVYVDDPVHFFGYKTGGSDPYTYKWDFGDGSSSAFGMNASHVYETSGIYLITLSVSDGKGNVDSVTREVMVNMVKPETYVEVCELDPGWNFISLTFNNTVDKTDMMLSSDGYLYRLDDGMINSFMYGWNRAGQYYSPANTLESGKGYWIFAYQHCELWLEKINVDNDNYITTVKPGWNIFGLPFEQSLNKEDVLVNDITWNSAVNDGLINDYIFGWDGSRQYYDFVNILIPGCSYWMYTSQSCILRRSD